MNRILFVDDEPEIPGGLHDSVHKYRHQWNMTFVSNGPDALAALAEEPFDVVVSDMRMPQMDGSVLLGQVKARYPRTARIILSGQVESDAVMRALPVTQQFMTKPCAPEQLWRVIERTCSLNGLMGNEAIRDLVGGLDKLPSVPCTYAALTKAMEREEVKISEVVSIVEKDTAMAVKILQLVNSAFFGKAQRVTSIPQAVTYLGHERLKALALSTHVFGILEGAAQQAYGLEQLQEQSMLTAQLARRFLSASGRAEEGFTAGLLQDVGRVALAVCLKDRYMEVVECVRHGGAALHDVERDRFGVTHAEIGAYLLSIWGLPATIIEAIAFHHAPGSVLHDDTDLVDAVHLADGLVNEAKGLPGSVPVEHRLDPESLARDGVGAKIQRWRAMAAEVLPGTAR